MHNHNVLLESNLELNLGEHLKTCQDINFAFFIQSLTTLVKKNQIQLLNSSEKLPKKDVIECLFNANSFFQYVKCRYIRKKL